MAQAFRAAWFVLSHHGSFRRRADARPRSTFGSMKSAPICRLTPPARPPAYRRVLAAAALTTLLVLLWIDPSAAQTPVDGKDLTGHLDAVSADLPGEVRVVGGGAAGALRCIGPGAEGRGEVVRVSAPNFTHALDVDVDTAGPTAWSLQVTAGENTRPVASGDMLCGSVMIRLVKGAMNQGGVVSAFVQQPAVSHRAIATTTHVLAEHQGWQEIVFWGIADQDFERGDLNMVLHLGGAVQRVHVGPMLMLNLGPGVDPDALPVPPFVYEGQAEDSPWRAEADRRIRQHRMAEVTIRVVDGNGDPIVGADVEVTMKDHAFRFGTFLGATLQLDEPVRSIAIASLLDTFNAVTLPMYWADWGWPDESAEPPPHYRENFIWAMRQGLHIRAHPVVWPGRREAMAPSDLWRDYDRTGDRERLRDRVDRRIDAVFDYLDGKPVIDCDLVNETRAETELTETLGPGSLAGWFERAASRTDMPLYINEYNILSAGASETNIDRYIATIRGLLEAGAPVGGIGFQGHFVGESPTGIPRVLAVLDRFAEFGLPLQVTEFDLNTVDRDGQAAYIADFLTAAFSHPSIEAVTHWGFIDANLWRPHIGLFDNAGKPRPAARAWQRLTREVWWSDAEGVSDAHGRFAARLFKGTFDIRCKLGTFEAIRSDASFTQDQEIEVVLLMDAEPG